MNDQVWLGAAAALVGGLVVVLIPVMSRGSRARKKGDGGEVAPFMIDGGGGRDRSEDGSASDGGDGGSGGDGGGGGD